MQQIEKGDLVLAAAGRESGKRFFVLREENGFLFLADGKHRRVEAPKRKSRRHVRFLAHGACPAARKIKSNQSITNSELRKALAAFGEIGDQDQEVKTTWQNPT